MGREEGGGFRMDFLLKIKKKKKRDIYIYIYIFKKNKKKKKGRVAQEEAKQNRLLVNFVS